ncbi:MAG: tetratricopeptide repeat protein [Promethearchaeota archaeon]
MERTQRNEIFEQEYQVIQEILYKDTKKAESYIRNLLTQSWNENQRIKLKSLLAYCIWANGRITESKNLYQDLLTESERPNCLEEKADALNGLGIILTNEGLFGTGNDYLNESIEIYQLLNLPRKEAQATNRLAINCLSKGEVEKASQLLHRTISLAQNIDPIMTIQARNNLVTIFLKEGQLQEGMKELKECVRIAKEINFSYGLSIMMSNYAEVLQKLGNFNKATKIYEEAIEFTSNIGDYKNLALIFANYSEFLVRKGALIEAEKILQETAELYQDIEDKTGYPLFLHSYAQFWITKGNYSKAITYLKQAYETLKPTGFNDEKTVVLLSLVEICHSLGNYNDSYLYLRELDKIGWQQKNKEGHIACLISLGMINIDHSNYDEAELILLDALQFIKIHKLYEYYFKAKLLLTQIWILRSQKIFSEQNQTTEKSQTSNQMQSTKEKEYEEAINQAVSLIEKSIFFAKEKGLTSDYTEVGIIRALLFALFSDFDSSWKLLTELQDLSKINGMVLQSKRISQIQLTYKNRILTLADETQRNQMLISLIIEEIQRITQKYTGYLVSDQEIADIFMIAYKMDEVFGPKLHAIENLIEETDEYQTNLYLIGSLYTASLGQGQHYNEGLFGPFPFGSENQRALVYSTNLKDSEQLESRNKGSVYTIICLVYGAQLSPVFFDQKRLEGIFKKYLDKIKEVNEITPEFLTVMRMHIIDEFIRKNLQ